MLSTREYTALSEVILEMKNLSNSVIVGLEVVMTRGRGGVLEHHTINQLSFLEFPLVACGDPPSLLKKQSHKLPLKAMVPNISLKER